MLRNVLWAPKCNIVQTFFAHKNNFGIKRRPHSSQILVVKRFSDIKSMHFLNKSSCGPSKNENSALYFFEPQKNKCSSNVTRYGLDYNLKDAPGTHKSKNANKSFFLNFLQKQKHFILRKMLLI